MDKGRCAGAAICLFLASKRIRSNREKSDLALRTSADHRSCPLRSDAARHASCSIGVCVFAVIGWDNFLALASAAFAVSVSSCPYVSAFVVMAIVVSTVLFGGALRFSAGAVLVWIPYSVFGTGGLGQCKSDDHRTVSDVCLEAPSARMGYGRGRGTPCKRICRRIVCRYARIGAGWRRIASVFSPSGSKTDRSALGLCAVGRLLSVRNTENAVYTSFFCGFCKKKA